MKRDGAEESGKLELQETWVVRKPKTGGWVGWVGTKSCRVAPAESG